MKAYIKEICQGPNTMVEIGNLFYFELNIKFGFLILLFPFNPDRRPECGEDWESLRHWSRKGEKTAFSRWSRLLKTMAWGCDPTGYSETHPTCRAYIILWLLSKSS